MPILDFFKKKKKPVKEPLVKKEKPFVDKALEGKKEIKKEEEKKEEKKPLDLEVEKKKTRRKRVLVAPNVLKSPHIAEKSTKLAEINQYVFKIYPKANKIEIKKAVEEIYGVDVLKVRIIKVPRKRRRLGRTTGWRKGYKKAIVRIKEDQKIDIMPR